MWGVFWIVFVGWGGMYSVVGFEIEVNSFFFEGMVDKRIWEGLGIFSFSVFCI